MDEKYKRITETQRFKELAASKTLNGLSKYYRISETTMILMLREAGIQCLESNVSRDDKAPTPEEEQASASSLRFAPMVAEKAREVTMLHVQFMRGEITRFPWDRSDGRRCMYNAGRIGG